MDHVGTIIHEKYDIVYNSDAMNTNLENCRSSTGCFDRLLPGVEVKTYIKQPPMGCSVDADKQGLT